MIDNAIRREAKAGSMTTASQGDATEGEVTPSHQLVRPIQQCRILAKLATGGMADVYLAVTLGGVKKLVVLKALRPELASEPEALPMFLDEARVAAQLNHPNVVQTYEVGRYRDRYAMVMEYLEGQSLSRLIRQAERANEPLSLGTKLRIVCSALEGLHYAHELTSYGGTMLELVHRDVSPQNIFVTYAGQVKILDFGIAKATSSSTQTAAGVVKGKLSYMAPEQMAAATVDRRADVYSVGCILYSFVTGNKPWQGVPDVQIMRSLLEGIVPAVRDAQPTCDEELLAIVEKAMAYRREDRYQTALELQADLEHYCERLGPPPKPKDIGVRVSTLFHEHRAELRRLIESRLARPDSDEVGLPTLPAPELPDTGTGMGEADAKVPSTLPPELKRRKWPLLAALLALPVVAVGFWSYAHWTSEAAPANEPQVKANPAPKPAVKEEPSAAAKPSLVTIRFKVTPITATLFLDDRAVAPGTESAVLPDDGRAHVLRAEATGYQTGRTEFVAIEGATLNLELTRLPPVRRVVVRPRPRVTPQPPVSVQHPPSQPNCTNPFFIDERGIKRVRAECR